MELTERIGLPGWLAWFGPMAVVMIASFVWGIYIVKREIDRRAATGRQIRVRTSRDGRDVVVDQRTR